MKSLRVRFTSVFFTILTVTVSPLYTAKERSGDPKNSDALNDGADQNSALFSTWKCRNNNVVYKAYTQWN